MEEHGQHSLLAYLKGRWMTLTLFALFFAVYLAVYLLYHAPLEPALYAALLCGVLAGLFLAGDYVRERRARRQLHACLAAVLLRRSACPRQRTPSKRTTGRLSSCSLNRRRSFSPNGIGR